MELQRLELQVKKAAKSQASSTLSCEVWGEPNKLLRLYTLIDEFITREEKEEKATSSSS